MYRCYLGPTVPAVRRCLLRWLLHALLAAGDANGQAGVLWHVSPLLLPGEGRGEAGHGDAGAMRPLRLLPRHPEPGVEDLHGGDGGGVRPPPAGGPHSSHGLLHLGPHLAYDRPRGRRHSVCRRWVDVCVFVCLSSDCVLWLEFWGDRRPIKCWSLKSHPSWRFALHWTILSNSWDV